MQVKETIGRSFPGSVESPPLEDVVVLADSAGVALGGQRAFSARVRRVRDGGRIASGRVEIPVVGSDGNVSGILCHASPQSDTHSAVAEGGREREGAEATMDVVQFAVHDIDNLLAVIGSGLRLLERQSDAERQKTIIGKMQEAITRGALLIRQLLDEARPQPKPIDGGVAGSRLVAIAGTLDRTLRPDITVRTGIAPNLWTFNAEPEELYFALLNLCRNSTDAMPDGGTITVAARNVEPSAGAVRGFVEIVVGDDGVDMTEEVLLQALTPYFTTKPAGSGTGLGLPQVRRFAEERGGAIGIESVRATGTLVRLFLPRVGDAAVPSSLSNPQIAYTPSPDGGVFHVVGPAIAAPT